MSDLVDPAIAISLNFQVDKNRQLVLQSVIERDFPHEKLDGLLDKLFSAADRKIAKYDADALVEDIEMHEKQLRVIQEDIDRVDTKHKEAYETQIGRRGDFQLTTQQKQERANAMLTKQRFEEEIKLRYEKLEKLRAKL